MLYKFEISGISHSGNPSVCFSCTHCGRMDFDMPGYLYAANLSASPRKNIEAACKEFTDRINCGDFNLFTNPKTANKLQQVLCHCDQNVVDLERIRGIKRARAILLAGLEQSGR